MGADANKVMISDDGQVDLVDCGGGTDKVFCDFDGIDPLDVHVDCESVEVEG